jgi:hypothetical protein
MLPSLTASVIRGYGVPYDMNGKAALGFRRYCPACFHSDGERRQGFRKHK